MEVEKNQISINCGRLVFTRIREKKYMANTYVEILLYHYTRYMFNRIVAVIKTNKLFVIITITFYSVLLLLISFWQRV